MRRTEDEIRGYVGRRVMIPYLDQLNVLARRERQIFQRVQQEFQTALYRDGLKDLRPSAVAVLMYVVGRTFHYGKYAERIPEAAFIEGVRDNETGEDVTRGINVTRNTLRKCLQELEEHRWVERWSLERAGRPTFAYVPKPPRDMLFMFIAGLGGTVPASWEMAVPFLNELLVYTGPPHGVLRPGTAVRFKSSDGPSHFVLCVDRRGNDVANSDHFFMVPRDMLRRMIPAEKDAAFAVRLCGDFVTTADSVANGGITEFMRGIGITEEYMIDAFRVPGPESVP